MSQVGTTKRWMSAINTADGSKIEPDNNGWVTLAAGTYVFALRTSDQVVESLNVVTDATIAFSTTGLTLESTNAGRSSSGQTTPGTVTDWDVSADSTWVQENPPTAYIATSGTGWTATAATLVKTAGKGAAMIQFEDVGCMRLRAKVVVTTGGTMRVAMWGKS
jgi:hypothetical protein